MQWPTAAEHTGYYDQQQPSVDPWGLQPSRHGGDYRNDEWTAAGQATADWAEAKRAASESAAIERAAAERAAAEWAEAERAEVERAEQESEARAAAQHAAYERSQMIRAAAAEAAERGRQEAAAAAASQYAAQQRATMDWAASRDEAQRTRGEADVNAEARSLPSQLQQRPNPVDASSETAGPPGTGHKETLAAEILALRAELAATKEHASAAVAAAKKETEAAREEAAAVVATAKEAAAEPLASDKSPTDSSLEEELRAEIAAAQDSATHAADAAADLEQVRTALESELELARADIADLTAKLDASTADRSEAETRATNAETNLAAAAEREAAAAVAAEERFKAATATADAERAAATAELTAEVAKLREAAISAAAADEAKLEAATSAAAAERAEIIASAERERSELAAAAEAAAAAAAVQLAAVAAAIDTSLTGGDDLVERAVSAAKQMRESDSGEAAAVRSSVQTAASRLVQLAADRHGKPIDETHTLQQTVQSDLSTFVDLAADPVSSWADTLLSNVALQFVALPFSKADAARCQAAEEAANASAEECKAKAESEEALKESNAAIQAELKDVQEQLAAATAAAAAAEKASSEAAASVIEVEALRVELATTQEKLIAAQSAVAAAAAENTQSPTRDELAAQLRELTEELQLSQLDVKRLEDELFVKMSTMRDLEGLCAMAEAAGADDSAELARVRPEIERLEAELATAKATIAEAESRDDEKIIAMLKLKLTKLEAKLSDAPSYSDDRLKEEVNVLAEKLAAQTTATEQATALMEQERQAAAIEMSMYKNAAANFEKKFLDQSKRMERMAAADQLTEILMGEKTELENKVESLEGQIVELTELLRQAEERAAEVERIATEQLTAKKTGAAAEVERLEAVIVGLRQEAEEVNEKIKDLQGKLEAAEAEAAENAKLLRIEKDKGLEQSAQTEKEKVLTRLALGTAERSYRDLGRVVGIELDSLRRSLIEDPIDPAMDPAPGWDSHTRALDDELRHGIERLQAQIASIPGQIEAVKAEDLAELERVKRLYERRIEEIKVKLSRRDEAVGQMDSLLAEISEAKSATETAYAENGKLNTEITRLKSLLSKQRDEVAKLTEELSEAQQLAEALQKRRDFQKKSAGKGPKETHQSHYLQAEELRAKIAKDKIDFVERQKQKDILVTTLRKNLAEKDDMLLKAEARLDVLTALHQDNKFQSDI